MPNPPISSGGPTPPITTHDSRTVVRETVLTPPPDNSAGKTGLVIVSVLAAVLLVSVLWLSNRDDTPRTTDVTVRNTEITQERPDTTVVTTDRVVDPSDDVQVFVTTTEADIERLSRPDNAANQAEVEAIRRRMEDLRQADQQQAAAIRQELQASIARLEAQAQESQTTTTTVASNGGSATVTTTSQGADAGVSPEIIDGLQKRLDDSTAQLSQLQMTAAPEAAAQVKELGSDLSEIQTQLSQLAQTPSPKQAQMVSEIEGKLVALETALTAVPIQ